MTLFGHLREWVASTDDWEELCDLQDKVGDLPETAEQHAAAERMADLLDAIADRIEASGLVRVTFKQTPAALRAEAAEFRAGRNPYARAA